MTPLIFVTGGVVSSLGKGIAAASLAAVLEARGLRVTMMKLDPYINVDPGTMSPFQHGEVYVTDDGAETDLDLGHYERYLRTRLSRKNSITTGRIYDNVIREGTPRRLPGRHRAGDPAHHRRDQALHRRGHRRLRRGPGRDRRHGRRHRVAAVPGSHPPDPQRARSRGGALHAPDAGAVDRRGRRAEDQAHAALGEGTALHRHPARRAAVPQRAAAARQRAPQDRAVHQRARARRDLRGRPGQHLQDAAPLPRGRAGRDRPGPPAHRGRPGRPVAVGRSGRCQRTSGRHRHDRGGRQVRRPSGRVQVGRARRSSTAACASARA